VGGEGEEEGPPEGAGDDAGEGEVVVGREGGRGEGGEEEEVVRGLGVEAFFHLLFLIGVEGEDVRKGGGPGGWVGGRKTERKQHADSQLRGEGRTGGRKVKRHIS